MAYSSKLADRVRKHLSGISELRISEKKMFGGLAFMVNDKMCINVVEDRLMCRFDPEQTEELAGRMGFVPLKMRGRVYKGYCYVEPIGLNNKGDFEFWINLSLAFNDRAKLSKTRQKK